jgi:starvation-inducible outer membrane lipoprotein
LWSLDSSNIIILPVIHENEILSWNLKHVNTQVIYSNFSGKCKRDFCQFWWEMWEENQARETL